VIPVPFVNVPALKYVSAPVNPETCTCIPAVNPAVMGLLPMVITAVVLMTCAAVVVPGWQIDTSTPAIGRPKEFTTGELVLPRVPLCAYAALALNTNNRATSAAIVEREKRTFFAANVMDIRSFAAQAKSPLFAPTQLHKPHIRSFICISILQIRSGSVRANCVAWISRF